MPPSTRPPPRLAPNPALPGNQSPGNSGGVKTAPSDTRKRIVDAISAIVEKQTLPTPIKGILSEYYAHVGRHNSFQDFPSSLHEHFSHPDNCDRPFNSTAAGLCHHVGSVIKAWQKLKILAAETTLTEALVNQKAEAAAVLARRLRKLEFLVQAYPNIEEIGNPADGYTLAVKQ